MSYLAHIEYSRGMKSRAELKSLELYFSKNKTIQKRFVGLQGRKFLFRFDSHADRIAFLKAAEDGIKMQNEIVERDGW